MASPDDRYFSTPAVPSPATTTSTTIATIARRHSTYKGYVDPYVLSPRNLIGLRVEASTDQQ